MNRPSAADQVGTANLENLAIPDKTKPEISVVVPVLNGDLTLRDLFFRTSAVLSEMNLESEIIFVDDGSVDRSWTIIRELKSVYGGQVRGFRLTKNSGQQSATLCGIEHARGSWILTLDDDLQSPPEEIPKLWSTAQEQQCDVVYGIYPVPKHGILHNLGSLLFHFLLQNIAPEMPPSSSFRLIRKDILNYFHPRLGSWTLLDPALAWVTSDVATVKVHHEKRLNGRSSYSLLKLANMAITILVIYSTLPLQLMIWFGLFSAAISFCIGVYYLILRLTSNVPAGFSALIVMMTFAFSVILLSLGVLGIYISRIYSMNTGQPSFTIRTEV